MRQMDIMYKVIIYIGTYNKSWNIAINLKRIDKEN